MKRTFQLLLPLFFACICLQEAAAKTYPEAEANNSFATAGNMVNFDTLTAAVGGPDAIDFFKPDIAFWSQYGYSTGTIVVYITATNTGTTPAKLWMDLYNGLQGAGLVYTDSTASMAAGATRTASFRFCGQYMDDFYLAFRSNGTVDYQVVWYFSDPNPNAEANNNGAAATPFPFDTLNALRQAVNYQYRLNVNTDPEDWFRTTLPAGDYANMALEIKAKNNSCVAGRGIQYAVYRNSEATPIATGYVGNNPSVAQFTEVFTGIPLAGFVQGDVLYLRVWSNAAFGYQLKYSGTDVDFEEEYIDSDYDGYSPESMGENETKVAQVGYHVYENGEPVYDDDGNAVIDNADSYRFTLPQNGEVTLFVKARNDGCGQALNLELLDEYGSSVSHFSGYELVTWNGTCSETVHVIKLIRAFTAGTYQLRIHNGNWGNEEKISYTIRYQFQSYTDSGNDQEYNNSQASALSIAAGETKKGLVNFISPNYDNTDHYKTTLNTQSSLKVYIRARYRGNGDFPFSPNSNKLTFAFLTGNVSKVIPAGNTSTALPPDGIFSDTIDLAVVPMGLVRFSFSANEAWEYEFRYEVVDSVAGPDDVEPNNTEEGAIPLAEKELKKGRVSYGVAAPNDTEDYYKTTLPRAGTINITVKAINRGATAANSTNNRLRLLVSGVATTYSLPDNPPSQILTNAEHTQTFRLCGLPAGQIFFRVQSSSGSGTSFNQRPYDYEISYEMEPAIDTTMDNEPDNDYATAKLIGSGQTHAGLIGRTLNGQMDMNDYHKLVMTKPDSLIVSFGGTNISCLDNKYLRLYGYNTRKQLIFFRGFILNAVGTVDAGQTVSATLREYIPLGDTVFLRMNADGLFNYWIHTEPLPPSSFFTVTGDSTACEGPAYVYNATGVADSNVTYHWSLPLGGGILTANGSTASVVWNESGNRRVDLYLSNARGNSTTRQRTVIVNGNLPTAVPVATNFSRTLRTANLPPGATAQWFKNGEEIQGATDSVYYAADAGSFTVSFVNDCGPGPVSNAIVFTNPALVQTINLPRMGTVVMAPALKLPLTATASSGMRVFYQKISGPVTLANDSIFVTGTGSIIIRAYQPGDDVYSAAPEKFDTITVVKGPQTITFDSIPDKIFSDPSFVLGASSTSGLGVSYAVPSGHANYHAGKLVLTGAGTITVRASQAGNSNYNAATPVDRSFCVGVRTLTPIAGDPSPCPATYRYTTQKIPGANFVWTLSGGGILTTKNDTAWVQWQTLGTHTLTVKANSACDTVYSEMQTFTATVSGSVPSPVSSMQPANFAKDQKLPLTLSWVPGPSTVSYDLYIWDSTATHPATPFAANLTQVSYVVPKNALTYNKTYKWRIVSKNPCAQTAGPVQSFRIIPLPDLVVSDVQAPATVNSGETITISWKVTNVGPGSTFTDDRWFDGVYFALDTISDFRGSPNWNPSSWSSLTANGRPLLLGKKLRPTALDSGEFYTSSLSFTLPKEYSFPVYVYVITDNEHPNWKILQASVANDTARKKDPVVINLSPTPDLRIDSVVAPVTAFSGSTVNLTYQVKNYGVVTPAGSVWTDSVFYSQNPLWDRNSAIPLMLPKADGSYYPNAVNAHVTDTTQLLPNMTRTKSVNVVIPNYLFGTWFIYVKTNADAKTKLYEGALTENNVNRAQIQVILTPTPKLTINTLSVQATAASTTQPFSVNWNVHNDGFRDNIEKARGHYFTMGTCRVSCGPNAHPNSVCVAPSIEKDSVVFGSSYWLDKVYISTDSNGLNTANARLLTEIKHGTQYSGIYAPIITCPANYSRKLNVDNVIEPNGNYPKTAGFNLPSDLAPGKYYIYVHTNAAKDVFEYPGTPQIERSASITIERPDVVVSSIAVPASTTGGQTINIAYNITNNGPGSVFNHVRKDQLYSSNFPAFDASATLLSTKTVSETIGAGSTITQSFTYQLPPSTSGARYFYVVTNFDSSFRETAYTNNRSTAAATLVSAAVPSDLTVTSVQLPDTVFTIWSNYITYSVANNGTGTTAGSWTDSLFVSCSPVFNPATSYFVASRRQTRAAVGGQAYTDTFSFALPKMSYEVSPCFPQTATAPAYFYIKANADTGTYEAAGISNNVSGAIARVLANPLVDLTIPRLSTTTDTGTVGRPLGVQWTVKNIGHLPPHLYYQSFYDGMYFSTDPVWSANDVLAASYLKYTRLKRFDSTNEARQITVPNLPTGDYYLFAKTNYNDGINGEKVLSNNTALLLNTDGTPKKVHIIRPLLPDLADSILSAPASVIAGQPITVIRRTTNRGAGATYPTSWYNDLRLSVDFAVTPNDGDRLLVQKSIRGAILPGAFRDDTVTITIPLRTIPGNYVLISQPDANGQMIESNEINNLGFSLLTVLEPPVVDLIVNNITHPDTVYLGYNIDTVKWTTRNASPNEAKGNLSEAVYLSQSEVFDSTAVLLGIGQRSIDLDALKDTAGKLTPLVTGIVEGSYNLFVKTDLIDNFLEEDEDNNATFSAKPVYVKVKELPLHVTETNMLHKESRYYKLLIPDSLIGSTIMVTLKSNDSLRVRNELYIAAGYVPSSSKHDYRFEIPNYGNQQIVMTDVSAPVYYIEVRSATPNAAVQSIELKAVKLPFAVLNVQSASGGNTGNVTVKISGSLFTQGMTAHLQKGGGTITASQVYFLNSTQAFATFNLKGAALGAYDVVLKKGDTANAILASSFSVVPTNNGGLISGSGPNTGSSGDGSEPGCDPGAPSGLNSQLVVELVMPDRVLLNRPVVILINFRNPTNVDVSAQTRVLFIEEGLKLAFRPEDVPNGTDAMYLELTEPGGPPGIIRAGGSGTIKLYTKAPVRMPLDPQISLKLK